VSLLARFLPPRGAPGAVRVGAECWRRTGDGLTSLADDLRSRSALLTATWHGSAADAYGRVVEQFLTAIDLAAADCRETADLLSALADRIEQAQAEYRRNAALVLGTAVVAVALTPVTFGASDEVGAAVLGAELAAATELATTAAASATACLAQLAAQAGRLALQVGVFGGVNVSVDVGTALITYRGADAWGHLDLRGDLEWGLVAGVAAPIRALLSVGLGGAPLTSTGSALARAGSSVALTGMSMASADVLVRLALGEHVDAAELAMAAITIGPRAKRLVNRESGMIGDAGTQLYSQELDRGKGWRLDVENPNPGQRPGQIHLQDYAGNKWHSTFEWDDSPTCRASGNRS
jgi:filamentous hemagglutinin